MNWQRRGSVLAWPFAWQQPNKTEEWAYECCLATLQPDPFLQIVCFPWATLIDLLRRNKLEKAQPLLDALHSAPPRITLKRFTVMQHIWAKDMLPHLRALGITDIYWSHATLEEKEIEGMRIHAFPMYPVSCGPNALPAASAIPLRRKYLYSFMGAYDPQIYLSPVRQWLYRLPNKVDVCIRTRPEWHFNAPVYEQQIHGQPMNRERASELAVFSREYQHLLGNSVFSLCPSGSGPASIRFWESMGSGCIPVLFSDRLRLPEISMNWHDCIVALPETEEAVAGLDDHLRELVRNHARLANMRTALEKAWDEMVGNFNGTGFFRSLRCQLDSRAACGLRLNKSMN